jgi:UDPglucose 6-dehydrogenase
MVVSVFGLGFVGLTTSLGLSEIGHKVYGYENNQSRSNMILAGKLPFLEPGLDLALEKHLNVDFFVQELNPISINESDVIFFCVGTPYSENGEADLNYLFQALNSTLELLDNTKKRVLVIKSTIPPSTTKDKIIPFVMGKHFDYNTRLFVANNPEFLREGYCWNDFMNSDRIVVGSESEEAHNILKQLYMNLNSPFYSVSTTTGEYIKYLSNTLLANLISFSNEMSMIANSIGGIDIKKAFNILHMDKRWANNSMKNYVYPGCGFGGYCLPKDTSAMYAVSVNKGYEPMLLKNSIEINNKIIPHLFSQVISKVKDLNSTIGILGLSFKPNSDDVRDSPSAKFIKLLNDNGYNNIYCYDPVAIHEFKKTYKLNCHYTTDLNGLLEKTENFILLTAWEEFKLIKLKPSQKLFDFRYFL